MVYWTIHWWRFPYLLAEDEAFVRAQYEQLAGIDDAAEDAREARDRALDAIGSRGSFFGGVVKLGQAIRSVMVVATGDAFVLLDADTNSNPVGELARIEYKDVASVQLIDASGDEVADASIDPVRELATPGDDRYAVVLNRADGSGTSISFVFLSGEPAIFAKSRFTEFLEMSRRRPDEYPPQTPSPDASGR